MKTDWDKLFEKYIKLKKTDDIKYIELKPHVDYILYAQDKLSETHSELVADRLREDINKNYQLLKEKLNIKEETIVEDL